MLKVLLLLPLLGAAVLSLLPSRSVDLMRHLASIVAAATMCLRVSAAGRL
jgi:NADH:ubiquinone oxidoreductase subunit 4 (subunit M)